MTIHPTKLSPARRPAAILPVALLLSLAAVVAAGAPAEAGAPAFHDDLSSASPGDGDTVRAVPGELRLLFTRPVNFDLASVTLEGPAGPVALGPVTAHPDSAALALVAVRGRWRPGAHHVRWRIVGQDGHPVSGEYGFVVADGARGLPREPREVEPDGPDTAGAVADVRIDVSPADQPAPDEYLDVEAPLFAAIRFLVFVGILGVVGAAWYGLVVLPLARIRSGVGPGSAAVRPEELRPGAALVGVGAATLLMAAAGARLWAQVAAALPAGWEGPAVRGLLLGTPWGSGWLLQAGAAVIAAIGFGVAFARSGAAGGAGPGVGWILAAVAALGAAVSPALAGHSGGTGSAVVVGADALHVLGAGVWLGTLLVLVVTALPDAVRRGSVDVLAPVVSAFSVTALGAAALVVATGIVASWTHLPSFTALWASGYGRVLLLKLALLLPVFATGAWNWLRVRPALEAGNAPEGFGRSAGVELLVAAAVLAVTAVLVATSPGV